MKLYNVPRNTNIKFVNPNTGLVLQLFFHHVDGAFSVCESSLGDIVHLSASADVEIVDSF